MVSNFFDLKMIVPEHDHGGHEAHYMVLQPKSNYNKVRMKADALLIKNTFNLSNFEKIKGAIQSYLRLSSPSSKLMRRVGALN